MTAYIDEPKNGEKMHLCSRCLHDDPNGRCDWDSATGTCRRG